MPTKKPKKFELGKVVATPGALRDFPPAIILDAMLRHLSGDWSSMSKDDQEANRQATHTGARVFGSYTYGQDRLWVITDAADDDGNRHATTFLLPSEY